MKYIISQQYAKEDEQPLAAFSNLDDAILFVKSKSLVDSAQSIKLIYRIYANAQLAQEFNKEKINIRINTPKYAAGDKDIRDDIYVPFNVAMKIANGTENSIARFNSRHDADLFIENKCDNDATVGSEDVFYLYQIKTFLDEVSQTILTKRRAEAAGAKGNEKKSVFRPTPLPNKLRLGPGSYFVDEDDDNKK